VTQSARAATNRKRGQVEIELRGRPEFVDVDANMVLMSLRQRPLRSEDEPVACRAHAEMALEGFEFLLDWQPTDAWGRYLRQPRGHPPRE